VILKMAAFTLLATPLPVFGLQAEGDDLELDQDSHIQQVIPPAMVDDQVDPLGTLPVDFANVEITTLTPADKFVSATTPLAVGLMLGTVSLVVYTLVSQSNPRARD